MAQDQYTGRNPTIWVIPVIIASFTACWIISGSTGLLTHPVKAATGGIALLFINIISFRYIKKIISRICLPAVSLLSVICFLIPGKPEVTIMGVAIVCALIGYGVEEREKKIFLSLSIVILIYGLYRQAVTTYAPVWVFFTGVSGIMGRIAGFLTGNELNGGITFTGIDFLVLTVLWYGACLIHTSKKRLFYSLSWPGIIIGSHLVYLIFLSYIPQFLSLFPVKGENITQTAQVIRKIIPWNFLVFTCIIHVVTSIFLYLKSDWSGRNYPDVAEKNSVVVFLKKTKLLYIGVGILTLFLVLSIDFFPAPPRIKGKKIVLYEKGYLNWLKPVHGDYGRLSIGMYGNLSPFIKSLGAEAVISPDLSENDIKGADLIITIYPIDTWGKEQLKRIWDFVRDGGSLLVMGEHTVMEKDGGSRINDLLEPSNIRVRFDSAMFAIGGWLHSYETFSHPITNGLDDDRNQFGSVIGASLDINLPARPLIIGKWGYADRGDATTNSMMGNTEYDPGELLGDTVLAAEQQVGKGKVIVFGDTSCLSNGINIGCHPFVARLFAYLTGKDVNPGFSWRFVLPFFLGFILAGLIILGRDLWSICLCGLTFGLTLFICLVINNGDYDIYPLNSDKTGVRIAYIDSSHNNAYSSESWRPEGTMGLSLNLFRNGYLNFTLSDFNIKKVSNADMFICIAPQKRMKKSEINALKKMVSNGLLLIITTGYDERYGSEKLLKEFGFGFHHESGPEINNKTLISPPLPFGFFKAPYLNTGSYYVFVRFYAGWPVKSDHPDAKPLVYGYWNLPAIMLLNYGKGKVVFIGDTAFVHNKNLENENGTPIEGLRENAHFWRWFLTYLEETGWWIPPNPEEELKTTDTNQQSEEQK
ncbi:MAG: hypothetical protein JXB88_13170 [Spirochaetales bacterium]|nr:hypothetical protein [Spirochaetales bacterium]